jgi:hypothetical protein
MCRRPGLSGHAGDRDDLAGGCGDRAGTGVALTGVALMRVALTGVALTGVALMRVALTGVALTGVALTGVALMRSRVCGAHACGAHAFRGRRQYDSAPTVAEEFGLWGFRRVYNGRRPNDRATGDVNAHLTVSGTVNAPNVRVDPGDWGVCRLAETAIEPHETAIRPWPRSARPGRDPPARASAPHAPMTAIRPPR